MAEKLALIRRAQERTAAKAAGVAVDQNFLSPSARVAASSQDEHLALPIESAAASLTDDDPDSPTFGKEFFIPDHHMPNDPNTVLRSL